MKLCSGIRFGSTEHNRKNLASSSESPETLSEIEVVTRGGIKEDLGSFAFSKNPLLACTGRLEIMVDKSLG